ncbi:MAG: type II secretion system protein M [Desulfobacterales bacterium]|nr:type II secretion system protein M [Desulfobacterales bacterium]
MKTMSALNSSWSYKMGRLSTREKHIVIGGSILSFLFICIQFIYLPAYDKRNTLEKTLAAEQTNLERIKIMQREYALLSPDIAKGSSLVPKRNNKFTLFSFLDRKAATAKVKDNIEYMKPHTRDLDGAPFILSIVKLKLSRVVLKDLIRFIRVVESSGKGIWFSSISITKSGKERQVLDATVEAHALIPGGEQK